ncbi:MAG: DNA-binding transcriptional MocR family regulator [Cellvibrionaceae bacterium]|jgi:DNA-binding transcriptional MocR family regulator
MNDIQELTEQFEAYKALNLKLAMTRGQPADANFDLSNGMLTMVSGEDTMTPSGIEIRNYPGGVAGLPEARELFGEMLGLKAEEMILGNNASLMVMTQVLTWALLKGLNGSPRPWIQDKPKLIVTVPGYDRHFKLAQGLGFELVPVAMTSEGPDIEAVEKLVSEDSSIKGIYFVPVYSNPTGESVSDEVVRRLVSMPTAAPDFTILADNAYGVHHLLDDDRDVPLNFVRAAEVAGNPNRAIIFGSTSKVTLASGGIGFMGTSVDNVAYFSKLFGLTTIGPNKIEQYRHVRFFQTIEGGIDGLMKQHAAILKPKFDAVQKVLTEHLGGTGLATWTVPKGGYFISLSTTKPVASRVVDLAKELGVALTPAGATYPGGVDPNNRNIRLAPTRPPVEEVEKAMEVVALCIKLASAEA